MSLELFLNIICDLAIKRNLVNYAAAGPSIYQLNAETIDSYPFIFVSPTNDVVTRKNFTDYTITLFYVDRLLSDNMNETHIFSIANDTLVNLLRQLKSLEGIVDVGEPTVRLFTESEKLNDKCAGAYAQVTITVLNDANCPVFWDEGGNPLGTYVPRTIQDLNVLDSLASKPWVIEYVAEHSSSGSTDVETVQRMIDASLSAYTKTADFATFNNSGITNGGEFNFVDWDSFNRLSGITRSVGITADWAMDYSFYAINECGRLSGITEEISSALTELSASTENIGSGLTELSGYTAQLVLSGGTDEAAVRRLINEALTAYTPTDSFAKINGSGITSGETYNLVNWETFFVLTDNVIDLSGKTLDAISGLTELSGYTAQLGADLSAYSALPQEIVVISAVTSSLTQNIEIISASTSSLTQNIEIISGVTSSLTQEITVLSAYTKEVVSAITGDVEALSGATSAALAGKQDTLTAGSGISIDGNVISCTVSGGGGGNNVVYDSVAWATADSAGKLAMRQAWTADFNSGKTVYMKATTTGSETVYLLLEKCELYDQFRYASDAYVCHLSINNTSSFGGSGSGSNFKVSKTNILTSIPTASNSVLGGVKVGSGLTISNGVLSTQYQVWEGSQEDYDLIANKDQNTFYVIK